MLILVAYSKSKNSVIRTYENTTIDLVDNIIDLSSNDGFQCARVLVIEDTQVLYDFTRGVSPTVSKRADVCLEPVRVITKRDSAMVKRAWDKALFNLKCANMFM